MTQQAQLDITGDAHPIGLTERQAYALEIVSSARDGIYAEELGAHMHARRDKHTADVHCQFCGQEGLGVLRELRRKGLVVCRRKRENRWFALGHEADSGPGPGTEIPF